ncbi:proteasome assembly chaperone family protein [Halomicroarcula sp. GCM10025324]|uniref:proteasome assembly chaperone family protein n=1 Tax=Haloarcula TaxID=2237 RepID=UPI0023E7A9D6|nr:PAC2 family protein [Halomicroarcula sp. ZS-22-S1]
MPTDVPSFDIETDTGVDVGDTLIVGTANLGLAGLTAIDYLVTHTLTEQTGHVRTRNLPDITPFTDGEPRNPMRLYSATESDISLLISEIFVPVWAGEPLADGVAAWVTDHGFEEVCLLHGVPFPHGPDEHVVFHVGTPEFRTRRIDSSEIRPLAGGFFEGFVSEFLVQSLDGRVPPTGVLTTPTHPPGPDFEAALRFLDALESLYGLEVDESELEARSEEMKQYYEELTTRLQSMEESEASGRDYPEDRMYM